MTENEIRKFVTKLRNRVETFVSSGWAIDGLINDYTKSADIIEKLMQEIQSYRAIGTVEELQDVFKLCESLEKACEMGNALVTELEQYQSIGTVNECRVAVERTKPKKVADDGAFGRCPVCDYEFNSELRDEYNISVCLGCFQVLDWN